MMYYCVDGLDSILQNIDVCLCIVCSLKMMMMGGAD